MKTDEACLFHSYFPNPNMVYSVVHFLNDVSLVLGAGI